MCARPQYWVTKGGHWYQEEKIKAKLKWKTIFQVLNTFMYHYLINGSSCILSFFLEMKFNWASMSWVYSFHFGLLLLKNILILLKNNKWILCIWHVENNIKNNKVSRTFSIFSVFLFMTIWVEVFRGLHGFHVTHERRQKRLVQSQQATNNYYYPFLFQQQINTLQWIISFGSLLFGWVCREIKSVVSYMETCPPGESLFLAQNHSF